MQHDHRLRTDEGGTMTATNGGVVSDREEGELSEDDISSDEEDCMRQRILELEAKNEELEKIARISGSIYGNEYNYSDRKAVTKFDVAPPYKQKSNATPPSLILSDISSISSDEFCVPVPKRRKRRKPKSRKKERNPNGFYTPKHHTHSQSNRESLVKVNNTRKQYRYERQRARPDNGSVEYGRHAHSSKLVEKVALNSYYDGSDDDAPDDECGEDDAEVASYLNRDKLRFALARNLNQTPRLAGTLRQRLQRERAEVPAVRPTPEPQQLSTVKALNEGNKTNSDSENELRLVALKSAVLKKHFARQKRNEELAYSPTDFDEVFAFDANHNDGDYAMEEVDVNDSMEISPVNSPKLLLSPTEDHLSALSVSSETSPELDIGGSGAIGNTKLVDMDIANSESDDAITAVEHIPLPHGGESGLAGMLTYEGYDYRAPLRYGIYVPEMHHYEGPPPPLPLQSGVANYDVETTAPAPSFSFLADQPVQVNDSSSMDCASGSDHETTSTINTTAKREKTESNDGAISWAPQAEEKRAAVPHRKAWSDNEGSVIVLESDAEEEEALRALLLAKFHATKPQKSAAITPLQPVPVRTQPHQWSLPSSSGEGMRAKTHAPTESILKEAVRRLQIDLLAVKPQRSTTSPPMMSMDLKHNNSKDCEQHSQSLDMKEYVARSPTSTCTEIVAESKNCGVMVQSDSDITASAQVNEMVQLEAEEKVSENVIKEEGETSTAKAKYEDGPTEQNAQKRNEPSLVQPESVKPSATKSLLPLSTKKASIIEAPNTAPKAPQSLPVPPATTSRAVTETPPKTISATTRKYVNKSAAAAIAKSSIVPRPEPSIAVSTKIVKPNKVINTTSAMLKRKSLLAPQQAYKKAKPTPTRPQPPSTAPRATFAPAVSTRLLTTADVSDALQVRKLIITLRASDTATSDDDDGNQFEAVQLSSSCNNNMNTNSNSSYYDNASPISLPMNSPCSTPSRAQSPNAPPAALTRSPSIQPFTKSIVNDYFEQKLDDFLKNVRSKVCLEKKSGASEIISKTTPKETAATLTTTPTTTPSRTTNSTYITPVAVRHLPVSSQAEYRRLVHRMKLLEKQKQSKSGEKSEALEDDAAALALGFNGGVTAATPTLAINGIKTPLIKEVLLKNANNSTVNDKANSVPTTTPRAYTATQLTEHSESKMNILRSYEVSFLKTGANIVSRLDKSLELVAEAREAKIAKLRHEQRLKELHAEMDEVQRKVMLEQQKISKIYPQVCDANTAINTLRQRRIKLFKAARNLGRTIKGDDYRLNNDIRQEIALKTRRLADSINLVNTLKLSDVERLLLERQETEQQTARGGPEVQANNDAPLTNNAETKEAPVETVCVEQRQNESTDTDEKRQTDESPKDVVAEVVTMEAATDETQLATPESHEGAEKESTEDSSKAKSEGEVTTDQSKLFKVYTSPLDSTVAPTESEREALRVDPNAIVCPFELMGECHDEECSYAHFMRPNRH